MSRIMLMHASKLVEKTRQFNIATVEYGYATAIMEFLGDHFGGDLIKVNIVNLAPVSVQGSGETIAICNIVGEYDPEMYDMDLEQTIQDQVYGLISGIKWVTHGTTTH